MDRDPFDRLLLDEIKWSLALGDTDKAELLFAKFRKKLMLQSFIKKLDEDQQKED